jgi:ATP-binding cassette subfamily B protein
MKNLLRVFQFFRSDAPLIAVVLLLMLLSTGANLVKPWPLAIVVDHLLDNKPLPGWLAPWVANWSKPLLLGVLGGAVLLLHFAQAALASTQAYFLIKVGLRGLARVRNQLFGWLQRMSLRFHQGATQGDVIYRASWDTYAFQNLFQHGLLAFIAASLSLVLMMGVMWRVNHRLTLIALGTVPLLLLAMKTFGREMQRRSRTANEADSRVTTLVQQSIAALPLTHSYTREEQEEQRFGAQVAEALSERQSQHGCEVMYLAAVATVFGLGVAGITWFGAKEVLAGRLSVGELLIFLAYLGQLYEPLNQLTHVSATAAAARAGTQRVFELLDTPEEVKDLPHARQVVAGTQEQAATSHGEPPESSEPLIARGAIEFDRVSFCYLPAQPVLNELSFRLNPGESAAIIGPSGAGKTTLIHLLPRFFDPSQGAVRLDGVDLRGLRLKDLRAQVALVMQEPILLPTTLAENIACGKPTATRAEIEAAAHAAHADEFIKRLPLQYDTVVGEGATRLSVGEKQRISLARAFLKDARILVLDEPTSALDAESERLVIASLRELMRGRTTLIVAHRLATILEVDKILVIQAGRLTESGSRDELLRQSGYFARLLNPSKT